MGTMAYDIDLAERIAKLLSGRRSVEQKRMFGGLCFMVRGHMCCGVESDKLVIRVGPNQYASALRHRHARPMTFTGRPLKGFVYVLPEGCKRPSSLRTWIALGLHYIDSLPAKR
jgi:TfoX/Sxy family transcriptional regulator of competence genes